MVLRLPKTLLDASLLEDEPFKKCFVDCEKQHTQRRRRSTARSSHVEQVVKALSEEGSHGVSGPYLFLWRRLSERVAIHIYITVRCPNIVDYECFQCIAY